MINDKLVFMRKLLEFSGKPLDVDLDGERFSIGTSGEEYVEVVHTSSRTCDEFDNPSEMVSFVRKFFDCLLPVDSDLYILILKGVMEAAHEQVGMTWRQMTVLIGALSETIPQEEIEQYLNLVKGIR